MSKEERTQQLHDKATRGEALTAEERTQLDLWYARQDQEEEAALAGTGPSTNVAALQAQVDAALGRLLTVTQRIQALTAENEAVRRDVAALQCQLTQKSKAQPA